MKDVKKISALALSAIVRRGADMGFVSVSESETREFNVDGGRFSLFRTLFDSSVALTAFKDKRRGTVGMNRTDEEAVEKAAEDCLTAAASSQPDDAWALCPTGHCRTFTEGCPEADLDRLFDRFEEMMREIGRRFPKVMVEQAIVTHKSYRVSYRNTSGADFYTVGGEYGLDLMFSAHDGDKSSSFNGTAVSFDSLDRPLLTLGTLESDLRDAEKQIETVATDGKFEGVMVLTPGCLGGFVDDILGNFCSDKAILDGTSIWKDAIGTAVADPRVTVSFRPHDPRVICGETYDSDGFLTEDADVIRDGILKSFMLSLYVSNKTGKSRFPNDGGGMIVEPGDESLESLIGGIKRGILVGRVSGGAPAGNGDFSAVAKNSFLIEDGKIGPALTETMVSGNLAAILKNVVGISQETVSDGDSVLPWVAFGGVVISGK